jgi:hypothetical protein
MPAGLGKSAARAATRRAEQATLLACRVLPHAAITFTVVLHPAAFGSPLYYALCVAGLAFTNYVNAHRVRALLLRPPAAKERTA